MIHRNFLNFLKNRPPLVLFTLCLIFFTIVLWILDDYVIKNDIPNPDTRQDWNKVLESFSNLEFCLSTNKTHRNHYMKNEVLNQVAKTHSVAVTLKMFPSHNILNEKSRLINTFITGKQLGMKGIYADEAVNVSFIIPPILKKDIKCYITKKCQHIDIKACIFFRTYSEILPTKIRPLYCSKESNNVIEKSKFLLYLTWHRKETLFRYLSCSKQTSFKTEYELDPGLTVMLTKEEKAVISTHLSGTIYLLLVLISLTLIYGVTCGYHRDSYDVHQSVPPSPSSNSGNGEYVSLKGNEIEE